MAKQIGIGFPGAYWCVLACNRAGQMGRGDLRERRRPPAISRRSRRRRWNLGPVAPRLRLDDQPRPPDRRDAGRQPGAGLASYNV